jgi:hypothetical protein
MIRLFLIAISLCIVAGCQTSGDLKPVSQIAPGVSEEGSLANEKLIQDATAGIAAILKIPNMPSDARVLKFVIQQPVGQPGSRAWREMWVVKAAALNESFLITFKESAMEAADFEISRMQSDPGT